MLELSTYEGIPNLIYPVITEAKKDSSVLGLVVKEIENRCLNHKMIAFLLYPVRIEDLFKVADAGKVMPPKSTWFEPKLRSGLVVRLLD